MAFFHDKVVVITGAGSGIGRALALVTARRGARLALSDLDPAAVDETLSLLPTGTEARGYRLDVSNQEAVYQHARTVQREFGTAHIIINNAGTGLFGRIVDLAIEDMKWVMEVNLWGVIYGTKAFLPLLLEQRQGCIVNMSSLLGLYCVPDMGAYCITKFGVRALTECLWCELQGTGVKAICVHPAGIRTPIMEHARFHADYSADFRRQTVGMLRYPTDWCALQIVAGIECGKARILIGNQARLGSWFCRLFPSRYPRLLFPTGKLN